MYPSVSWLCLPHLFLVVGLPYLKALRKQLVHVCMQPAWQLVQFFCDPFFAFVLALSLSHVLTLTVKLHPLQTSVGPSWSARRLQPSASVAHPPVHPSIQLSVRNWRPLSPSPSLQLLLAFPLLSSPLPFFLSSITAAVPATLWRHWQQQ